MSPIQAGLSQTWCQCQPRKELLKPGSGRQALLLQHDMEDGPRAVDPGRAGPEHKFYHFLCVCVFEGPHPRHTEFPRLRDESGLQLLA